jgi:hypothetical protein
MMALPPDVGILGGPVERARHDHNAAVLSQVGDRLGAAADDVQVGLPVVIEQERTLSRRAAPSPPYRRSWTYEGIEGSGTSFGEPNRGMGFE